MIASSHNIQAQNTLVTPSHFYTWQALTLVLAFANERRAGTAYDTFTCHGEVCYQLDLNKELNKRMPPVILQRHKDFMGRFDRHHITRVVSTITLAT